MSRSVIVGSFCVSRPNGWVASVYAQSPIMSTYQVCICIGDFLFVEADWQGVVDYQVVSSSFRIICAKHVLTRSSVVGPFQSATRGSLFTQNLNEFF